MSVRDKLIGKLLKDATKLAKNYDYMVSCGDTNFCSDMSFLFAYDLDICEKDIRSFIDVKFKSLPPGCPTLSSVVVTECDFNIQPIEVVHICSGFDILEQGSVYLKGEISGKGIVTVTPVIVRKITGTVSAYARLVATLFRIVFIESSIKAKAVSDSTLQAILKLFAEVKTKSVVTSATFVSRILQSTVKAKAIEDSLLKVSAILSGVFKAKGKVQSAVIIGKTMSKTVIAKAISVAQVALSGVIGQAEAYARVSVTLSKSAILNVVIKARAIEDSLLKLSKSISSSINAKAKTTSSLSNGFNLSSTVIGKAISTGLLATGALEAFLTASATLQATAQKVGKFTTTVSAKARLTAELMKIAILDSLTSAIAKVTSTANISTSVNSQSTAKARVESEATLVRTAVAYMEARATSVLNAIVGNTAFALLSTNSTVVAAGKVAKIAAATTTGTATLSATGVRVPTKVTWNAILNLNSTATFLANAIALDTNAKAFFTAAGITNTTQQNAVNKFVKDLKSNSLWSKLTVIYPFVGGTASTHAVNLKTPGTYNATFNGTITHNASGVKGNGTTGYFNTGITPSAFPQNSLMVAAYYIDGATNAALFDIGVLDGSGNGIKINSRSVSGQSQVQLNSSTITNNAYPNTSSGDFQAVNRSNGTQFSVFSSVGTGTFSQTSTAPVSLNIFGLAVNNNGTATDFSTRGQSFFAIGTGFTNTEVETFRTLVRNMQADLSRS